MLCQEFVSQDLASLAAPCHGINVEIGKALLCNLARFITVGEDGFVVIEHGFEELVLNVLAPQRLAVVFLEVLHLVAAVHGVVLRTTRGWFLALPSCCWFGP